MPPSCNKGTIMREEFNIFLAETAQALGETMIYSYQESKRVVNTASMEMGLEIAGKEHTQKKMRVTIVAEPVVFSETIYPEEPQHDTSVSATLKSCEEQSTDAVQ